jgi:hypothetical protein
LQPVYDTGAINGLPAISFNHTNNDLLNIGNPSGFPNTGYIIVVWYLNAPVANGYNEYLIGGPSNGTDYGLTGYTGSIDRQTVLLSGTPGQMWGSANLSTTAWHATMITWATGTSATFYTCASNICTADGTAQTLGANSSNWNNWFGAGNTSTGTTFDGSIARWIFGNSSTPNLTTVGTYLTCKYGL